MRQVPQYGPDALILDLEDCAGNMASLRDSDGGGTCGSHGWQRRQGRRHGLTGLDLEAVTCPQLYGILLPKVEEPSDVVEVRRLIAPGRTDRKIADELVISSRTVNSQVRSTLHKTAVANRTEAVTYADRKSVV